MPAAARGVFTSEGLARAERFAGLLASEGVTRGLLGPREVPRLWERHLLNCAVLGDAVASDARVCDVGSGAGLPGLVLAIARPDVTVTLVEPLLRRTTFLTEVVDELGLANCSVLRARAEELHRQAGSDAGFDTVTARAVAPLGKLLGWAMPLVSRSGALLAMKGRRAPEEIAASRRVWRGLGCTEPELLELGGSVLDPPTTVVRVAWANQRRVG